MVEIIQFNGQLLFLFAQVIRSKPNVCKSLHMPAQSGNTAVLERMRRGYSREAYLELVGHIRDFLPDVSLSSDFICGFCDETEEEFEDTLSLMNTVKYVLSFICIKITLFA